MTIIVNNWCEELLAKEMTLEQAREIIRLWIEEDVSYHCRSAGWFADKMIERFPNLAKHQRVPVRRYHYSTGFIDTEKFVELDSVDYGNLLYDTANQIIAHHGQATVRNQIN